MTLYIRGHKHWTLFCNTDLTVYIRGHKRWTLFCNTDLTVYIRGHKRWTLFCNTDLTVKIRGHKHWTLFCNKDLTVYQQQQTYVYYIMTTNDILCRILRMDIVWRKIHYEYDKDWIIFVLQQYNLMIKSTSWRFYMIVIFPRIIYNISYLGYWLLNCVCPNPELDIQRHMSYFVYVQWVEVRSDC